MLARSLALSLLHLFRSNLAASLSCTQPQACRWPCPCPRTGGRWPVPATACQVRLCVRARRSVFGDVSPTTTLTSCWRRRRSTHASRCIMCCFALACWATACWATALHRTAPHSTALLSKCQRTVADRHVVSCRTATHRPQAVGYNHHPVLCDGSGVRRRRRRRGCGRSGTESAAQKARDAAPGS